MAAAGHRRGDPSGSGCGPLALGSGHVRASRPRPPRSRRTLLRFNTVNPPGNERPAIEYLEAYLREAGFFTELLAADDSRPNLVATLDSGEPGPVMVYLGHVDTVLADPEDWTFDPWAGEISGNHLVGPRCAGHEVTGGSRADVAAGPVWRGEWLETGTHGTLKLVFVVDEETGGGAGAHWLTEKHPDRVRCDYLINEGAAAPGRRVSEVAAALRGLLRREERHPPHPHGARRGGPRLDAARRRQRPA